ncbi:MAG: tetratricopeptide repeat protein [Myxococcales bacterium]|nr:tetratricopeptide repeat protein [Myxococcales bacterium]
MPINRPKVLEAAQKYLSKGNYDRAIAEFQKVLKEDPKDVRTWLKVGDLFTRKGDRNAATETYKQVAHLYAQQGFYLKAVAVYKQILKIDPTRIDVMLSLAAMHEQLHLKNDALATYEQVARAYARDGDIQRALDVLAKMVSFDPDNIPVRIKYAEALSQAGKKDEAADSFAVGASLLKSQGRLEDYIKVAERFLYHRPTDLAVAKELASMYLERRDPKKALTKLQLCFKADPRNAKTLEMLAHAFLLLNQPLKAISVYRELARFLLETHALEQRAHVLNKILELDPNDREARQALAAYAPSSRQGTSEAPAPSAIPLSSRPPPFSPAAHPPSSRPPPHAPAPSEAPAPAAGVRASAHPPTRPVSTPPLDGDYEEIALVEDDDSEVVVIEDAELLAEGADDDFAEIPEFTPDFVDNGPALDDMHQPFSVGGRNSIPGDVAERAQVARLLTECEVFERYGLQNKVIDQLSRVLSIDPLHIEAREKLKDAFVAEGRFEDAIEQLSTLAQIVRPTKPEDAERYLNEARVLESDSAPELESAVHFDEHSQVQAQAHPVAKDSVPPRDTEQTEAPSGIIELPPRVLDPISPEEFEAAPLRGSTPQEESAARARALNPTSPVEEALDEAEFFAQQALFEEARITLAEALENYPGHPLLQEKMVEIAELAADQIVSVPGSPSQNPPTADESFLLAEKLAEEIDEVAHEQEDVGSDVIDVETVFAQFKKGVEETVSADDTETHYDLGIAYMEMGLTDDAIHEFELAATLPSKECTARTMIGLCHERKGAFSEAIEHFKRGLAAPARQEHEELALYFELGNAYEQLKDTKEALFYYEQVAKRDPGFRHVEARIEALKDPAAAKPGPRVPEQDEIDAAFDDLIAKD